MKLKALKKLAVTLSLLLAFGNLTLAQTLTVSGEVATQLKLKTEDLASYKQVTCKVSDHGTEHDFKGVALFEILEKAGVPAGGKLRGKNLLKYVLIKAADGYEVIYALPEIDPEFTDQVIMLALEKDGEPLPKGEGPFRLIAPKDKKAARWVREIVEIKVLTAKE
ncbi:molybdopterin-dependent oxidoreductase [Dyadobacter aurulentus]|uniref:molybdopterin-dependent oxidoreductase n=1 Tax=Dyadobacter sp. UC 10 TaxID=2605428 RepID=UPI0011F3B11B|nr:molybdopterin-dependent oxidoreductase [Dyadobacter sp. UC 10]KAA0990873.1 molybdopterin-dependent oxidoreductase [Dyadobacter sp. UC 10]